MIRTHSDGVNLVRLHVSRLGGLILPYTVGKFRAIDSERVIKVGRPGVADTLACIDGRFVAIEVKVSDGDSQKEDQCKFQAALERAGGTYLLADFRKGRNGLDGLQSC